MVLIKSDLLIILFVSAAPIFRDINDGPHDINVTTGDSVIINCNAYAIPTATVTWFLNGQQFDSMFIFSLSLDLLVLPRALDISA